MRVDEGRCAGGRGWVRELMRAFVWLDDSGCWVYECGCGGGCWWLCI